MKVSEIKVSYSLPKTFSVKIHNSEELFRTVILQWDKSTIEMQEIVKVVLLNQSNTVIGIYELSKGGVTSSIVDLRLMMSVVLKCLATGIAIIHNHPSGNLKPSKMDLQITQRIKEACQFFDITLIDHLIISKKDYFSFADEGILK